VFPHADPDALGATVRRPSVRFRTQRTLAPLTDLFDLTRRARSRAEALDRPATWSRGARSAVVEQLERMREQRTVLQSAHGAEANLPA
jgi:hypothetical protein